MQLVLNPYQNSTFSECLTSKKSVLNARNYQVFGVVLSGRSFIASGVSKKYRMGYQGSEMDNEVKGEGNSYTTEFRQLDPRLGRWLSIDPKMRAWESPYVSMGNNPIFYNDPLGDTIQVTGPLADQFLELLNKSSDVKFKYIGDNILVLENPDSEITGEFMIQMVKAINDDQTIIYNTIEQNKKSIVVDEFRSGDVDVDDVKNFSPNLFKLALLHYTVERFAVENYEANKESYSPEDFDKVHKLASEAEARMLTELYPKQQPQFFGEYSDKNSISFNTETKPITGTFDYIWDFGKVSVIYTFPIIVISPGKWEIEFNPVNARIEVMN